MSSWMREIMERIIQRKDNTSKRYEGTHLCLLNVYTQDEPEILQIDRRSVTDYDDTLNKCV